MFIKLESLYDWELKSYTIYPNNQVFVIAQMAKQLYIETHKHDEGNYC